MLKIIAAPNSILSQTAKPCTVYGARQIPKINANILKLIEEMKKTLLSAKDPEGVGLAAPQVGKALQLFITKPTPKSKITAFINPKIVSSIKYQVLSKKNDSIPNTKYKIHNTKLEGCLSLPNIWGEIARKPSITLSYLDKKGKNHTKTFKGLFSVIIQHEVDHLNGILFPKKVLEQKGKLYKSHKNEKGEDVFEKIEI